MHLRWLIHNQLQTVPSGVFDDLGSLEELFAFFVALMLSFVCFNWISKAQVVLARGRPFMFINQTHTIDADGSTTIS